MHPISTKALNHSFFLDIFGKLNKQEQQERYQDNEPDGVTVYFYTT
jgi:hypothetical protein